MHLITNNINGALPYLAKEVMQNGWTVDARGGQVTREVVFGHIALTEPWAREILIPERKASLPAQIAETMWVLAGRDDVDWLERYLPRARDFSDDGKTWRGAYGPRLRHWPTSDTMDHSGLITDQLSWISNLMLRDPLTRRAVATIYDPGIDSQDGKDIPCNNWLHFIQRGDKLHLHVTIRSNDLIWGWSGINAFEWSVLLEIMAHLVGVPMGELHFSITSLHIYEHHFERAEQLAAVTDLIPVQEDSPRFNLGGNFHDWGQVDHLIKSWFFVEDMIRNGHDVDQAIGQFPEPMFQSWLYVLAWHWRHDERYLEPIEGTPLAAAARLTPGHAKPSLVPEFVDFVNQLHIGKHKAYGDSWKRRGEQIGIMANIARKIDRLGVTGGGDTATDTAIDLLVYLCKYRVWMAEQMKYNTTHTEAFGIPLLAYQQPLPLEGLASDRTEVVYSLLKALADVQGSHGDVKDTETWLIQWFDKLEHEFSDSGSISRRVHLVEDMMVVAWDLAFTRWKQDRDVAERRSRAMWNPDS
jgi:thymidylate synthase